MWRKPEQSNPLREGTWPQREEHTGYQLAKLTQLYMTVRYV